MSGAAIFGVPEGRKTATSLILSPPQDDITKGILVANHQVKAR